MKRSKYLSLRLKCAAKAYPAVLIIMLLTITSLALVASLVIGYYSQVSDKKSLRVGVVNMSGGELAHTGLSLAEEAQSSFKFEEMTGQEARAKLKKQEIVGYVVIPEGYVEHIFRDDNIPATYVTTRSSAGLGSMLTMEITQLATGLVTEAQTANHSMQDVAHDIGATKGLSQNINDMDVVYLDAVMSRDSSYELQILGVAGAQSTQGYYVCAMLTLFLLLWGIACCRLFIKKDYALARVLATRGTGAASQIMSELLAFFAISFATALLLAIFGGAALMRFNAGIRELAAFDMLECIKLTFKIIPVILMFGAMQLMIYEAIDGIIGAVLAQFITVLGCGYISGCLYPAFFFPDAVRSFGSILPTGVGFAYIRDCIAASPTPSGFVTAAAYTIIFVLIAVLIRKLKMKGGSI